MEFTYDQIAAKLCPEDRTPELVEHYRPCLEYLCEIDEQVKKDLPGAPLDGPGAIALHHHYVRNGLPYEQEQG